MGKKIDCSYFLSLKIADVSVFFNHCKKKFENEEIGTVLLLQYFLSYVNEMMKSMEQLIELVTSALSLYCKKKF